MGQDKTQDDTSPCNGIFLLPRVFSVVVLGANVGRFLIGLPDSVLVEEVVVVVPGLDVDVVE